ncbi:MAG: hypothetical protein Roseis2KO_48070 [Roseivirga sp.]
MLFQVNSIIGQDILTQYTKFTQQHTDKELDIKVDSLLDVCDQTGDMMSKANLAWEHALYYVMRPDRDFVKALKYGLIEVGVFESGAITNESFRGLVKPERVENGHARDSMHVRALYLTGRFYKDNALYENAIELFERVIALDCLPKKSAQAYAEIGNCKNLQGDFYNAILQYKKGIGILEDIGDLETVVNQSINMAMTYRNINTPESFAESLKALEKADSLQQIVDISLSSYVGLMNDLGNQYNTVDTYDFGKAYRYYQKCLRVGFTYQDSVVIGRTVNNLANLYNLRHADSALYFIKQGFDFVVQDEVKARLFDNQSDYHLFRGNLKEALNNIHKALETNLQVSLMLDEVPDALPLSKSELKSYTIFCLKKKSEVLNRLFEKTGNRDFLKQSILNVKAADQLIDIIQSGSYENETKLLWRKEASEVYIKGVYAAQLLDQPEELFYFTEKNKALLLSEEIAKNTAYTYLPNGISEKAKALKKAVFELENTASVGGSALFDTKQRYESYIDSVKKVFPDYFKDKVSIDPVPLSQWQQSLKPDATFISYIWNRLSDETEALIGLAVNRDKSISFTITSTEALRGLLGEYQQLVAKPLQTNADRDRFFAVSAALYNQLLPNAEVRKMAGNKRLIIVPDGPLQGIPFESLVIGNEKFLIEHTDVSYLYSVSFLKQNNGIKRKASQEFLAYAPVSFEKTAMNPLKKTVSELNAIEEEIGGDLRFEDRASKGDFLSRSNDYMIIHLATHANANKKPWIAFSDGKVELYELYTYRNNAELVTLSACNTLLGEEASGEGVLSLSRGFFYSGAKSVVASLWNIDDQSTSMIMADFYANLKAGQGKSQALNNAKRKYLRTHSLSEQSPYYWSSFVLIGDDAPIDFSDNLYAYLIAILLLSLLVFIFVKKKQKT